MSETARHSLLTAREHEPLPCGYAPRALHLSYNPPALFVGSKDGTIQVVVAKDGGYESFPLAGCAGSGVRALAEWQPGWLWVGRRGGEVQLVDVRKPRAPRVQDLDLRRGEDDPVRALGRIDEELGFLSFHASGTWIVEREAIGERRPKAVLERAFARPRVLRDGRRPLCDILFIVPFEQSGSRPYLLANTRGEIFSWAGGGEDGVQRLNPWPEGEEPGFVNDFTVAWADRAGGTRRSARGVFLATDRGVYLLHFAEQEREESILCRRLSLPGLGAVCMAITYAEPKSKSWSYLWAADSRGDGHLYRARKGADPARPGFLPSGLFHAGNQSMLATSWYREKEACLVVCQVRRNDQVVLTEYRDVGPRSPAHELEEIRELLSLGDARKIARFWGRQADPWVRAEAKPGGWPSFAQLSEMFELLAERNEGLEKLLEFLGDPSAQAAEGILNDLAGAESRTAIELWTLSLLGVLNRAGGKLKASQRDAGYLGIIRWLRDLRWRIEETRRFTARARQSLLREIDTSISMVRKWGLFGEANAQRENLIRPLFALSRTEKKKGADDEGEVPRDQALDLLTYEVLLFERGVALRAENRSGNLPGRNAWDLAFQRLWSRDYCAVSWHWGWVEVFEIELDAGREPELKLCTGVAPLDARSQLSERFRPLSAGEIAQRNLHEIPKSQYRHSRAVLLGSLSAHGGERAFLVTAPTQPRSGAAHERLHLWELARQGGVVGFVGRAPVECPLSWDRPETSGDSVHSLLHLGSGWLLAGLAGPGGAATCLLVRVVEKADGSLGFDRGRLLRDDTEKEDEATDYESRSRNRAWSLAKVEGPPAPGTLGEAVVGCEDGSILRLVILDRDGVQGSRWTRVAKMSSAVKVLACRWVDSASGPALRVFAGGANGSIVAWQELPEKARAQAGGERYASLWAAHEGEEIAGLHLVEVPEGPDQKAPMVLGITRDERFVFFNDRADVAELGFGRRPTRIPLPGCRHGTLQRSHRETASAFATFSLPPSPDLTLGGTGGVAAVLTASKHGVLRLLSLHYPHFQALRKRKFEAILSAWRRVVQGDHQLRLVHAAYRTAPSLELILVRWLLDPAWPQRLKQPLPEGLAPWMLPRNLRWLLDLRRAWVATYAAVGEPAASGRLDEVYASLLAALREAFRLDDLLLYQEICEVVLQRGNWELFTAADEPAAPRSRRAARLYLRVFEAIEESLQQWRGGLSQDENLARINVARNMVDGDTAYRVSLAAARKERSAKQPFRDVLARRIGGVRDLVLKGDARVTLEALRAANLSLLRLCKRLVDERKAGRDAELAWENVFEPYFRELTAAAAHAFRSPLKLSDVVAHNYARTFALVVCACPSSALRIAMRMTETQLISSPDSKDDLCWLVPRQFQILEEIGIPVLGFAQELFRIGSRPQQPTLDPLQDPWLVASGMGRTAKDPSLDPPVRRWKALGRENVRDLGCLWRLYGLVNWVSRLETDLSRNPKALTGAWTELAEVFASLCHEDIKDLYRHSFAFWCVAVQRLAAALLPEPGCDPNEPDETACRALLARLARELERQPSEVPIEPRTVLLSRKIAAWATAAVEDLERRYKRAAVFQPEYSVFRESLARLARVAAEFPYSAAVRMNVVQGVLGHHLLEDLDEHLFELQEIAHTLDPVLVRQYREGRWLSDGAGSAEPVAQRFAEYLMTRSERAESLPENLRTLFSLLDWKGAERDARHSVAELVKPFAHLPRAPWKAELGPEAAAPRLSGDELRHLGLVLKELALNDEKHARPGNERLGEVEVRWGSQPTLWLEIEFHFPVTEAERNEPEPLAADGDASEEEGFPRGNLGRLRELKRRGLQSPIKPRTDRRVPSSGMGLYVANFAAAIVNWELKILAVKAEGRLGTCVFRLAREVA